ncbi:type II toxin-antitoxin system VapC family toxin [Segetibacter aerophilus]|uniref:Nucleotide-binding protein n=1 Tax=Segetibacter aerophilus TaxID=670293 RepID=A0A512BDD4_9BACT|nr:type II toxin-antitoxin system VapC family toxin [Segetibacter aerophilus]GEO09973.1 nucleotide-binding protein [Segetibacter aerophilus]
MGKGNLIDTNTAIDYLAQLLPPSASQLIEAMEVNISIVTRIELLCWPNATDNDTDMLLGFISSCTVINLSEPVVEKTIEIRKKYRLKLGDAIVAATALLNRLDLYTRNVKDFDRVLELKIFNPYLV